MLELLLIIYVIIYFVFFHNQNENSPTPTPTPTTTPTSTPTPTPQPCEATQSCNPVDCVGEWGGWGTCSGSCASGGTQTRTANITQAARYGGNCSYADASGNAITEQQSCTIAGCLPSTLNSTWNYIPQCQRFWNPAMFVEVVEATGGNQVITFEPVSSTPSWTSNGFATSNGFTTPATWAVGLYRIKIGSKWLVWSGGIDWQSRQRVTQDIINRVNSRGYWRSMNYNVDVEYVTSQPDDTRGTWYLIQAGNNTYKIVSAYLSHTRDTSGFNPPQPFPSVYLGFRNSPNINSVCNRYKLMLFTDGTQQQLQFS